MTKNWMTTIPGILALLTVLRGERHAPGVEGSGLDR